MMPDVRLVSAADARQRCARYRAAQQTRRQAHRQASRVCRYLTRVAAQAHRRAADGRGRVGDRWRDLAMDLEIGARALARAYGLEGERT